MSANGLGFLEETQLNPSSKLVLAALFFWGAAMMGKGPADTDWTNCCLGFLSNYRSSTRSLQAKA